MNQKEKEEYIANLKGHSDRELLELQTYYARKTADYSKSSNHYLFTVVGFIFLILAVFVISQAN